MYTAPEVALALERGALAALPSFAIDAFSLGLVLFQVLVSPHRAVFESDSDATARLTASDPSSRNTSSTRSPPR